MSLFFMLPLQPLLSFAGEMSAVLLEIYEEGCRHKVFIACSEHTSTSCVFMLVWVFVLPR